MSRAGQLVRLMGSDRDGEALNACRALGRLLETHNVDWHWLADIAERNLPTAKPVQVAQVSARPEWQTRAENLLRLAAGTLTKAEIHFLGQMTKWTFPTERQLRWLGAIEQALTGRRAA